MNLRILAFTDIHGNAKNLEKLLTTEKEGIDIIVFCGDAAPYHSPSSIEYLFQALSAIALPSVVVPGNMDSPKAYEHPPTNVKVIHGGFYVHKGYAFIGIGGSPPTPFGTYFELSEDDILKLLEEAWMKAIKFGPIIVVSHAPPYQTACDKTFTGMHVGSKSLRKFIEDKIPILCICGHIHESRAIDRVGDTVVVNPGPLRNGYYAVIEVEDFEVRKVELKKL